MKFGPMTRREFFDYKKREFTEDVFKELSGDFENVMNYFEKNMSVDLSISSNQRIYTFSGNKNEELWVMYNEWW